MLSVQVHRNVNIQTILNKVVPEFRWYDVSFFFFVVSHSRLGLCLRKLRCYLSFFLCTFSSMT